MSDEIYKCVRDPLRDAEISYCGKVVSGTFHFIDPTHAILNNQQEGRLLICDSCRKKISDIMLGNI